jgi:hypothetical protein
LSIKYRHLLGLSVTEMRPVVVSQTCATADAGCAGFLCWRKVQDWVQLYAWSMKRRLYQQEGVAASCRVGDWL